MAANIGRETKKCYYQRTSSDTVKSKLSKIFHYFLFVKKILKLLIICFFAGLVVVLESCGF